MYAIIKFLTFRHCLNSVRSSVFIVEITVSNKQSIVEKNLKSLVKENAEFVRNNYLNFLKIRLKRKLKAYGVRAAINGKYASFFQLRSKWHSYLRATNLVSHHYFECFRFHKYCIQKFAATAGYFFKCPLCNNKEIFETEMQSFGVYVPEQDAEWETQDNGTLYDDLLERHNRCDADECVCPEGRETDEDYTIWEIVSTDNYGTTGLRPMQSSFKCGLIIVILFQILCWCCGAQGIHVKCGDLPLSKDMVKWKCKECLETIKKMPKRTIHKFRRIQNRRSRKSVYMHSRQTLEDILDTTTINLEHPIMETSGENISKIECILNDEGISARIDACPKVM